MNRSGDPVPHRTWRPVVTEIDHGRGRMMVDEIRSLRAFRHVQRQESERRYLLDKYGTLDPWAAGHRMNFATRAHCRGWWQHPRWNGWRALMGLQPITLERYREDW